MRIADIKRIGVVGAGQMGRGIAQVCSTAGWDVEVFDVDDASLRTAAKKTRESLARGVGKGTLMPQQVEETLGRLRFTPKVETLAEAHLVIEAAPENLSLKLDLFRRLGQLCKPEAVFASNTSSISITSLGAASGRPSRMLGLHFMNPVPVMPLVEIVRGLETADDIVALAIEVVKHLGKTSVICKDAPGFLVNRILMPMINEAIFALQEGVAAPESIDLAMTAGTRHPEGPLALADRIGLDTVLAICEVLHRETGDQKFRPCPLLRQYVEAGWLGRKTGHGFYSYQA